MKGCDEGGNKMQAVQVDQTDEEVEATNKQMFSAREKAQQRKYRGNWSKEKPKYHERKRETD